MDRFERLDFEGPKKEFIKNNLMFVLGDGSQGQKDYVAQIAYDQELKYSHNRYLRVFYRVIYKNDPTRIELFNKRMISIIDKTPRIKKWLKAKLIGKPDQTVQKVSLQHLFSLSVNDFVTQLYIVMLGRVPDNDGFNSWQKALCSSMPKEAAIFAMSRTNEFGNRFQIKNIENYKSIYRKYKAKRILKRTPLIGYIISAVLMPKRIEQLMTSQNISYENMISVNSQFHNTTLHRINEVQAFNHQFLCEFISKIDECDKNMNSRISDLHDEILSINEGFEKQLIELRSGIDEGVKEINTFVKAVGTNIKVVDENVQRDAASVMSKLDYSLRDKGMSSYLQMYDPRYEMETLKQSNISLLEKLIANSSCNDSDKIVVVGHYAREIFEDVSSKVSQISYLKPSTLESVLCSKVSDAGNGLVVPTCLYQAIEEKQDKVIVLNSAVATMLVTENKLQELALKTKNELILVFDSNGGDDLSVVWGEGFSGIEQSVNGEFYRWYKGVLPNGVIHVFNNTSYRQNCTVSFSVTVLDIQAQLVIHAGKESSFYNMENGYVQVSLDMVLAPGVNAIVIEYYGKAVQPINDLRFLKFAIKGFSAVCGINADAQLSVNGADAYKKQTSYDVPLPIPSDEIIRNSLHLNGFFEVESLLCSDKMDMFVDSGLSRYSEANLAYKFLKPCQICHSDGLNIYIAKRKGEYAYDIQK